MIQETQLNDVRDATVYGIDGDKIGKAGQVYLDDATGRPEWVTVNTGLFGSSESFVPLADATLEGDRLVVPFEKSRVKDAPRVGDDGHLSPQEEDELYRYYGVAYEGAGEQTGMTTGTTTGTTTGYADRTDGTDGYDTSGPTTDDAMTRSEEHLQVGTESREAGRARLRKHVVTEQQTVSVPVTREEVRVEREPITDGNVGAATDGPAISEEEHEVVLHEERPVVSKEATPVERVRLSKDQVQETETVSDEVRKEQIDVDAGTEARDRR